MRCNEYAVYEKVDSKDSEALTWSVSRICIFYAYLHNFPTTSLVSSVECWLRFSDNASPVAVGCCQFRYGGRIACACAMQRTDNRENYSVHTIRICITYLPFNAIEKVDCWYEQSRSDHCIILDTRTWYRYGDLILTAVHWVATLPVFYRHSLK